MLGITKDRMVFRIPLAQKEKKLQVCLFEIFAESNSSREKLMKVYISKAVCGGYTC